MEGIESGGLVLREYAFLSWNWSWAVRKGGDFLRRACMGNGLGGEFWFVYLIIYKRGLYRTSSRLDLGLFR